VPNSLRDLAFFGLGAGLPSGGKVARWRQGATLAQPAAVLGRDAPAPWLAERCAMLALLGCAWRGPPSLCSQAACATCCAQTGITAVPGRPLRGLVVGPGTALRHRRADEMLAGVSASAGLLGACRERPGQRWRSVGELSILLRHPLDPARDVLGREQVSENHDRPDDLANRALGLDEDQSRKGDRSTCAAMRHGQEVLVSAEDHTSEGLRCLQMALVGLAQQTGIGSGEDIGPSASQPGHDACIDALVSVERKTQVAILPRRLPSLCRLARVPLPQLGDQILGLCPVAPD
jgi:hypothetical protein